MSKLGNALKKLDKTIDKLETTVKERESKLVIDQQDLFGSLAKPGKASITDSVDTKILARKIDHAIETVEQLLRDA